MKIKLQDIVIDEKLIVRKVNYNTVAHYAEAMRNGAVFPPIVLDAKKRLICGNHRYEAYKKIFEPTHSIEYTPAKGKTEADLLIESAVDNAMHGLPLDTWDKKVISLRLIKLGVPKTRIAAVFCISVGKLETWSGMTVVVLGKDGAKREAPIKRGASHMQGSTVSESEYAEHQKHDSGATISFHARMIIRLLERSNWINSNEATVSLLQELYAALDKHLSKPKKIAK